MRSGDIPEHWPRRALTLNDCALAIARARARRSAWSRSTAPVEEPGCGLARWGRPVLAAVTVDEGERLLSTCFESEDDLFAIGREGACEGARTAGSETCEGFLPVPSGWIVMRLAGSLARMKSALVVRTISFPSGAQSCLIATSQPYGVN